METKTYLISAPIESQVIQQYVTTSLLHQVGSHPPGLLGFLMPLLLEVCLPHPFHPFKLLPVGPAVA